MIIEYIVGRFLHEEYYAQHFIPEMQIENNTTYIKLTSNPAISKRRAKKAEWSTLRKSKHI